MSRSINYWIMGLFLVSLCAPIMADPPATITEDWEGAANTYFSVANGGTWDQTDHPLPSPMPNPLPDPTPNWGWPLTGLPDHVYDNSLYDWTNGSDNKVVGIALLDPGPGGSSSGVSMNSGAQAPAQHFYLDSMEVGMEIITGCFNPNCPGGHEGGWSGLIDIDAHGVINGVSTPIWSTSRSVGTGGTTLNGGLVQTVYVSAYTTGGDERTLILGDVTISPRWIDIVCGFNEVDEDTEEVLIPRGGIGLPPNKEFTCWQYWEGGPITVSGDVPDGTSIEVYNHPYWESVSSWPDEYSLNDPPPEARIYKLVVNDFPESGSGKFTITMEGWDDTDSVSFELAGVDLDCVDPDTDESREDSPGCFVKIGDTAIISARTLNFDDYCLGGPELHRLKLRWPDGGIRVYQDDEEVGEQTGYVIWDAEANAEEEFEIEGISQYGTDSTLYLDWGDPGDPYYMDWDLMESVEVIFASVDLDISGKTEEEEDVHGETLLLLDRDGDGVTISTHTENLHLCGELVLSQISGPLVEITPSPLTWVPVEDVPGADRYFTVKLLELEPLEDIILELRHEVGGVPTGLKDTIRLTPAGLDLDFEDVAEEDEGGDTPGVGGKILPHDGTPETIQVIARAVNLTGSLTLDQSGPEIDIMEAGAHDPQSSWTWNIGAGEVYEKRFDLKSKNINSTDTILELSHSGDADSDKVAVIPLAADLDILPATDLRDEREYVPGYSLALAETEIVQARIISSRSIPAGTARVDGVLADGFSMKNASGEEVGPSVHETCSTTGISVWGLRADVPAAESTLELSYSDGVNTVHDKIKVWAECGGCSAGSCSYGAADGETDSVLFKINLGKNQYGGNAGYLRIYADRPSADLSSPVLLEAVVNDDVNVVESGGVISSIETSHGDVEVDDTPTNGYNIYFKDNNGVKIREYRLGKGVTDDTLFIQEIEKSQGWIYSWDEINQKWTLSKGLGTVLATETCQEAWNQDHTERTVTTIVTDSQSTVVSKCVEIYEAFPWGQELIQRADYINDPSVGEAITQTKTWDYYDDDPSNVYRYGQKKSYQADSGYWEHYQYSTDAIKTISQLGNNAYAPGDLQALEAANVVTVRYESSQDLDLDTNDDFIVTTEKECAAESLQSKHWTIRWGGTTTVDGESCRKISEIDAEDPDEGEWDDAGNTVTVRYEYGQGSDFEYKTRAVVQPGGSITLYEFSDQTISPYGDVRVETATRGGSATYVGGEVDIDDLWDRTITYSNEVGRVFTKRQVYDGSGWVTLSLVCVSDFDDQDRPTEREYYYGPDADEPGSYDPAYTTSVDPGCCGAESEVDRFGIVTEYTYDGLGRTETVIRADGTSGELKTTYVYDAAGRTTQVLRGEPLVDQMDIETSVYDLLGRVVSRENGYGDMTFYTYRKVAADGDDYDPGTDSYFYSETRVYPHDRTCGPISVTWINSHGQTIRSFTATVGTGDDWAGSTPDGDETLIELSRTTYSYDSIGRLQSTRSYHNLTGLSFADLGFPGTNYYYSWTLYDHMDRAWLRGDGMGNVVGTVYDAGGRPSQTWIGTSYDNAVPSDPSGGGTNNMKMVAQTLYDVSGAPKPYATRRYIIGAISSAPSDLGDDYIQTDFEETYDANGTRHVWTKPEAEAGPWTEEVYDAEGRLVDRISYVNDDTDILTKTSNEYYDYHTADANPNIYDPDVHVFKKGRLRIQRTCEVTDVGGLTGESLATEFDYDDAGRQCKVTQPGGAFTKTLYDSYGRTAGTYLCTEEGDTEDANSVEDDTVVTESILTYDNADRVTKQVTYERLHDATCEGGLAATPAQTRPTYVYAWYDEAGSVTCEANYGNIDPWPEPAQQGSEPNLDTDSCIATKYETEYGTSGVISKVFDNTGQETWTYSDALGRTVKVVENYDDGTPSGDTDRTTEYTYNAANQVLTQTAVAPNLGGDQETTYTYGGDSPSDPVKRKNLLTKVEYPDGGAGDCVEMTYYANGALASRTDQRGTVMLYEYDAAGRKTAEVVDDFGGVTGDEVDETVQQISYEYDDAGRLKKVVSYDESDNVVNAVENVYDVYSTADGGNGYGYGKLKVQKQDVDSDIDETSDIPTQEVGYTLDESNGYRLSAFKYPNDRVVGHTYGAAAGISDVLSRVEALTEGTSGSPPVIVNYTYDGVGRFVKKAYPMPTVSYPETGVYLDYTADSYAALDRFGRTVEQKWYYRSWYGGNYVNSSIFDVEYGYDNASNRTYADRQQYPVQSQSYTYDGLHRLDSFQKGTPAATGIDDGVAYWVGREQAWGLDQVGNHETVDDFGQIDWYAGKFNVANEYDGTENDNRQVKALAKPSVLNDDFSDSATDDYWADGEGDGNTFTIDDGGSDVFQVTSLGTPSAKAVFVTDGVIGPHQAAVTVKIPSGATQGWYAGYVFGYVSHEFYWMLVAEQASGGVTTVKLYEVSYSNATEKASYQAGMCAGTDFTIQFNARRGCIECPEYVFPNGFPAGKVGLIANTADTEFEDIVIYDDALNADLLGRWANGSSYDVVEEGGEGCLHVNPDSESGHKPALLKNVRLEKFRSTFSVRRPSTQTGNDWVDFVFDAKDQDHLSFVRIYWSGLPEVFQVLDGGPNSYVGFDPSGSMPNLSAGDVLWVRVTYDGTDLTVEAQKSASEPSSWASVDVGYDLAVSNFDEAPSGGFVGFGDFGVDNVMADPANLYVGQITVESYDGSAWVVEMFDGFELASGLGADELTHDAAGNLTYDGLHKYYYDAWNRLAEVKRAYRDASAVLQTGSTVATMQYDGLGRRVVKVAGDGDTGSYEMGDWEAAYHYYYDGQRMVEVRNGDDQVLKQYVWGLTYVDELVQIAMNQDPQNASTPTASENLCERFFYALQDANYNVLGLVNPAGRLVERYEYTPYGQRTVYSHGWHMGDFDNDGDVDFMDALFWQFFQGNNPASPADSDGDGDVDGDDDDLLAAATGWPWASSDPKVTYPRLESGRLEGGLTNGDLAGLCDIGHQGLLYDREFGKYYNRARFYDPIGRFMQRDPMGYVDGMSLYEYVMSDPLSLTDPSGLSSELISKGEFMVWIITMGNGLKNMWMNVPEVGNNNLKRVGVLAGAEAFKQVASRVGVAKSVEYGWKFSKDVLKTHPTLKLFAEGVDMGKMLVEQDTDALFNWGANKIVKLWGKGYDTPDFTNYLEKGARKTIVNARKAWKIFLRKEFFAKLEPVTVNNQDIGFAGYLPLTKPWIMPSSKSSTCPTLLYTFNGNFDPYLDEINGHVTGQFEYRGCCHNYAMSVRTSAMNLAVPNALAWLNDIKVSVAPKR